MLDLQDIFNHGNEYSSLFGANSDLNHQISLKRSGSFSASQLDDFGALKVYPFKNPTVVSLSAAQSLLSTRTLNVLTRKFSSDFQSGPRLQGAVSARSKQAPSIWIDVNHEFNSSSPGFDLKPEDLMVSRSSEEYRVPQSGLSGLDAFYPQNDAEIKSEDLFSTLPSLSSAPNSGFTGQEAMDTSSQSVTAVQKDESAKSDKKIESVDTMEVDSQPAVPASETKKEEKIVKPKRKRGRPSKRQLAEEKAALLPKQLAQNNKYESEEQCLKGDTSDRLALLLVKAFDKRIELKHLAHLPDPDQI
jgi:hypothetical protein